MHWRRRKRREKAGSPIVFFSFVPNGPGIDGFSRIKKSAHAQQQQHQEEKKKKKNGAMTWISSIKKGSRK
jgi:hypothetical protein